MDKMSLLRVNHSFLLLFSPSTAFSDMDEIAPKTLLNRDRLNSIINTNHFSDIYDSAEEELAKLGYETECLGGGRILHDSVNKTIKVYGYSMKQDDGRYCRAWHLCMSGSSGQTKASVVVQ
ncbi:hypothetical protein QYM36_013272 [Artemia franciscana]|uniref:Uncharacterized protein n=1 Tax=Artemia franciscana TaxID=6661 RepID=A0AA88HPQ5_ARTSF|nr:hypothetical protein QYM36_013272 [Artemia franciscana]